MNCDAPAARRQGGAALVGALVLMLAAMLAAVSIARAVAASNASARAGRERSLAHAAAEAALRDAEHDIAGTADPGRAAQFDAAGTGFVDGCGRGAADRGLCRDTLPPAWQVLDLAEAGHPALVPYGLYTGATLPVGRGLLPARLPAYLIEKLEVAAPGSFYRITAIGFGAGAGSQVVLQSVYHVPPPPPPPPPAAPPEGEETPSASQGDGSAGNPAPPTPAPAPPPAFPAGRIGWRDVPNWRQLHAEASE